MCPYFHDIYVSLSKTMYANNMHMDQGIAVQVYVVYKTHINILLPFRLVLTTHIAVSELTYLVAGWSVWSYIEKVALSVT